jgi:hypothetical protein
MSSKILIAVGLLLAFVFGTVASGLYTANNNSVIKPEDELTAVPARVVTRAPAATTRYVAAPAPRRVVVDERPVEVVEQPKKRSWEREVLIVGGSAGAGAAIGAVAGGKKGAAIGALSGGVAGLVYDMATRNKR